MKTFKTYADLPNGARYLGGEYPDGTLDEATADAISEALNPARIIDEDGAAQYFELAQETTA